MHVACLMSNMLSIFTLYIIVLPASHMPHDSWMPPQLFLILVCFTLETFLTF
jgi:hypothetical protein